MGIAVVSSASAISPGMPATSSIVCTCSTISMFEPCAMKTCRSSGASGVTSAEVGGSISSGSTSFETSPVGISSTSVSASGAGCHGGAAGPDSMTSASASRLRSIRVGRPCRPIVSFPSPAFSTKWKKQTALSLIVVSFVVPTVSPWCRLGLEVADDQIDVRAGGENW
jgi:hypothetical protein